MSLLQKPLSKGEARPLVLGRYPTPVQRIDALSAKDCDLWVKRDDLTQEVYGGNKVRKLEHLLADAIAHGARRVVTIGAVGSHHVLATTHFGRLAGLEVEAVLVPQARTPHVLDVLRADVALGLHAFPASSWGKVPWVVAWRMACGARFIPLGGSSVLGSMGYVTAARELAAQVRDGVLPEPDVCVVALGSGGTAAGLAAGFEAEGLSTRIVGVCVSPPAWVLRGIARRLARACARRLGMRRARSQIAARLSADARFIGDGYGRSIDAGVAATRIASDAAGLALDPTYTAKAFASALWHVRARRGRHILYWHTLSSAPMAPLLEGAAPEEALATSLRALVRRS
jgi:1-aminocyclopropane-1-carboxylate deaminase/D-cysteine desulfhydrase-like pyridoxal-dependent ACC family enzyme